MFLVGGIFANGGTVVDVNVKGQKCPQDSVVVVCEKQTKPEVGL